jgi:hypothetical protein
MQAVACALPLALGSLFAVLSQRAEATELPPLFAERPATHPTMRPERTSTAVSSGRARELMNMATHQVLANASPFTAPVNMTPESSVGERGTDTAVVMEPFMVRSAPVRIIERRLPDPPMLDFLKTGMFYRSPDGKGLTSVGLKMMILKQPGLGWGQEFTRARIEFTFRW